MTNEHPQPSQKTRKAGPPAGTIENDSDYYPYGGERVIQQNVANEHYKFGGKEWDSESGLDEFGARYYASTVGRFMTPDWSPTPEAVPYGELSNPQTLNRYSYVKNNPETLIDPNGHCWGWFEGLCNVLQEVGNKIAGNGWNTNAQVLQDRRDWLVQYNVVATDKQGNTLDWSKATPGQVNSVYNQMQQNIAGWNSSVGRALAGAMIGAKGTQVTSKTLWEEGGQHIDVENPNPGQRPGQIHYQDAAGNKYIFNIGSGEFEGLSRTQSDRLLTTPGVRSAIEKGLRYLGGS